MNAYQMKRSIFVSMALTAFALNAHAKGPAEAAVGKQPITTLEKDACVKINKLTEAKVPAKTIRVKDYIAKVDNYTKNFNDWHIAIKVGTGIAYHRYIPDTNKKPTKKYYKAIADGPDARRYKMASVDEGNGVGIQLAIDACFAMKATETNKCNLYFEPNGDYKLHLTGLNGRGYPASLLFVGSNVEAHGCNATITNKSLFASHWGDTLSVLGLIYNKPYPHLVPAKKASNGDLYLPNLKKDQLFSTNAAGHKHLRSEGKILSENINIHDLTIIETGAGRGELRRNCVSLMHTNNVTIQDVSCADSPQTSFAVISAGGVVESSPKGLDFSGVKYRYTTENRGAKFINLTSSKSGIHAFRFIALEGGYVLGASLFKSKSLSVNPAGDTESSKDENGEPIGKGWPYKGVAQHVLYRNSLCNSKSSSTKITDACKTLEKSQTISDAGIVNIEGNYFDESANIMGADGMATLTLKNNTIKGGVYLKNALPRDKKIVQFGHPAHPESKTMIVKPSQGFSQLSILGNSLNCDSRIPAVIGMYKHAISPDGSVAAPIVIGEIESGIGIPVYGEESQTTPTGGMSGNFLWDGDGKTSLDIKTTYTDKDGKDSKLPCVALRGTSGEYFSVTK